MKRIHIVGAGPRTGTTLLAECMVTCFDIDAFEPHEAALSQHKRNVGIYLTKNPVDLHIVGPRLVIDQHFYVIAMLRDPRDVIVSTHHYDPDRYWAPLRFWKNHTRIIRQLLEHRRFVVIRYEDLVCESDATQDMLVERIPFLKKRARFSEFHNLASPSTKSLTALSGLRPIGTGSIGNWRNHLPRIVGQVSIHGSITQDLIDFGYEKDNGWLSLLDGVEPNLSLSHWPELAPLPVWEIRRLKYTEAAIIAAARLLGIALV
jgi:hypothetical protein